MELTNHCVFIQISWADSFASSVCTLFKVRDKNLFFYYSCARLKSRNEWKTKQKCYLMFLTK
jgi:hypothetical protein